MIITVEQYNKVLNGLRAQLELQREMTDEKNKSIQHLQEQLKRATDGGRDTFNQLVEALKDRDTLSCDVRRAITYLNTGVGSVGATPIGAELICAVADLRDALAGAQETIDQCKARSRKRK